MSRSDWLVGDRNTLATERIYAAAAELIVQDGFDAFSIEALAARAHCSRATVYRHVGGKSEIREAVAARAGARIIETVRRSVEPLSGCDRVLTAIRVAVAEVRSDPAGHLFVDSLRGGSGTAWLRESPAIAAFATDLAGIADDPAAAGWIVRMVLSLLLWPPADAAAEDELLQRFVAPAFDAR
jgi:AcrR family transcriptional regulator